MPGPALVEHQSLWSAALAALMMSLLWLWRGFSLGVKVGELVQEVRGLRGEVKDMREEHRADFTHLQDRFDNHIDKKEG